MFGFLKKAKVEMRKGEADRIIAISIDKATKFYDYPYNFNEVFTLIDSTYEYNGKLFDKSLLDDIPKAILIAMFTLVDSLKNPMFCNSDIKQKLYLYAIFILQLEIENKNMALEFNPSDRYIYQNILKYIELNQDNFLEITSQITGNYFRG